MLIEIANQVPDNCNMKIIFTIKTECGKIRILDFYNLYNKTV